MKAEIFSRQTTLTNNDNRVSGTAAVYWDAADSGTQYQLADDYVVRFTPGSLILEPTVFCYWSHDSGRLLGKTPDTLSINFSPRGMEFTASLPDTSYARDLKELMAAGIVAGCSFGCYPSKSRMTREKGLDVKWFEKVNVFEISPTHDPAFSASSSALLDREKFHKHLIERNEKRLAEIMKSLNR